MLLVLPLRPHQPGYTLHPYESVRVVIMADTNTVFVDIKLLDSLTNCSFGPNRTGIGDFRNCLETLLGLLPSLKLKLNIWLLPRLFVVAFLNYQTCHAEMRSFSKVLHAVRTPSCL